MRGETATFCMVTASSDHSEAAALCCALYSATVCVCVWGSSATHKSFNMFSAVLLHVIVQDELPSQAVVNQRGYGHILFHFRP